MRVQWGASCPFKYRLGRLGLERQKSGVRGKEQESEVRKQGSEVRSQNEEYLVRTFCSLVRAFRFVLTTCIFFSDPAAAGPAIIFLRLPVTLSRVMESIKEKPQSL